MPRGVALVTGASSGIGAELARLCAADGFELALVARSVSRLEAVASVLAGQYGVAVRVLPADLTDASAPESIYRQTSGSAIEILINNAGFALHGPFAEIEWTEELRLLQVNIVALTHLTRMFLPGMLRRGSGRILNVASTAAFVPGPFMATYYASKAFVLSFSEAVANEVKGTGVTVTALCPGPTRTGFDTAAGISGSNLFRGPVMEAEEVAREGYRAMMAGRMEVVAGARNRWLMRGVRLAPRSMVADRVRRLNSNADPD